MLNIKQNFIMEIVEKIEIGADRKAEVEAVIDTGADISVINEDTLLSIGAKHVGNIEILTAGEPAGKKPVYYVGSIKIRKCKIPITTVIGGKKNLIGHDILQNMKAKIDEGNGTIEFPEIDKNYLEI